MNTPYLDYVIEHSDVIEFKRRRAQTELATLRAQLAAARTALDIASFIVLNKRNFTIGDRDGVAAATIDNLAAALAAADTRDG